MEKIILGIDIGGSTTKIVGLQTDGTVISMFRVRAEDQVTSLYGALGHYLTSNGLALENIARVVLTGVGASFVEGSIYDLPTCKVEEFEASGTGALALSGQESAVVVTMGTGTAFLWAQRGQPVRHLCGSGIGGGTLGGLCHKLVGMERFGQIKKLAAAGDLNQVDLTIKDLSKTVAPTLDPDMTAANFGNLAEDASPCRPGRRGGEPGAPGHRHYDGAGLPGLRRQNCGPHRVHDHAGPGGAQLPLLRAALRHPLHRAGQRHLCHGYRRWAVQPEEKGLQLNIHFPL